MAKKGKSRLIAEAKIDKILKEYYTGVGVKKLTKKYLPFSKDAKNGTASTVLETVISENLDPKKFKDRPVILGNNQMKNKISQEILSDPKLKQEFIDYSNKPGIKIKDIIDNPKFKMSRTTLYDTGLRELLPKKFQLGREVDPAVTSRLMKIQNVIAKTNIPKTQLKVDTPIVKEMAEKLDMDPKAFLQGANKLKEIYKTDRSGFTPSQKVKDIISRFPDAGFNRTLFLSKGFSKKTVKVLDAVEQAAKKITEGGSQLEHSMPKALIKEFKLPRSNYLKGERTSNFLNQFKSQFDNQIINAAKEFRDGKISYDQYKKIVSNLIRTVAKRTGGYKQGYIDFKNGNPKEAFAVTDQESILKKSGPMGQKNTGVSKFLKNASHHNELFRQYTADPTNVDFGTLRTEVNSNKKFKFVPEPELEKLYDVTKNLKTPEEFFDFYKTDNSSSKLFRTALTKAAGNIAKGGRGKMLLAGAASLPLFATALAAGETNQPQGQVAKLEKPETVQYNKETGSFLNTATEDKTDQNQLLQWGQENPLTAVAGTSVALSANEVPRSYKMRRGVGDTGPLPGGKGKIRSAIGIGGALKPLLTTLGTPAIGLGFESLYGKQRLEEGDSVSDILTDPLGPAASLAFMEPLSKASGVVRGAPKRGLMGMFKNYTDLSNVGTAKPGLTSKALRLGMSPRMIAGASRFLGLPGLALTGGLAAYDAYKNYQNEEGMIYNLFNDE